MALPTPEKSWLFDNNIGLPTTGSTLSDYQILLWTIKNKLVGSNQFTVAASATGGSAGSVDYWASPTSLAWAPTSSWIVLRRVTSPHIQLLIHLVPQTSGRFDTCLVYWSVQGFTGGSSSTRPTAPDEAPILPGANARSATPPRWKGGSGGTAAAFSSALHYSYTTDGRAQRFFLFEGGICRMWIDLQEVRDPSTGWYPFVGIWRAGATYQILHREWCGAAIYAGAPWQFSLGTEGYGAQALGERQTTSANELDTAYHLTPASVVSTYPGTRGRHGVVYDLWFGQAQLTEGTMYPADDSKQLVTVGNVVTPWNGVNILLG